MKLECAIAVAAASSFILLTLSGCTNPSAANIALRRELQQRDETIAQLNRQHAADVADIAVRSGPTTRSIILLSPADEAKIYTVHGLKLGRLTDAANLDSQHSGDDGLKIQATPTDDDGQSLKAAGTFEVSAFDLSDTAQRLGHWTFDDAASRANWFGSTLLYSYVLPCPWQTIPSHSDLTVRVTYTDTLSGRKFTEQKQIHLQRLPTTEKFVATSQP